MKQETIKEVAERYVDSFEYSIAHPRRVAIKSFINGAKWQQDKQDEFAIGFKIFCDEKYYYNIEELSLKELLKIYKKEKGL